MGSRDVIGRVTIWYPICHFLLVVLWNDDDSALCPWALWRLGHNISETVRDRDSGVQRTTNRKWPIPSTTVTWPMTSRDPERSKSWPRYAYSPISRKRLVIETDNWPNISIGLWPNISKTAGDVTWWQWSTYTKWSPGNQLVMWPMTSRDPIVFDAHYLENGWRYTFGDNTNKKYFRLWPI